MYLKLKTCHKLIYKLHSKQLKKANWNLTLDLETAMRDQPDCIVSLNDSEALRFIAEINGEDDINAAVSYITNKIKQEKRKPRSRETKVNIKNLYQKLYEIQFQKDYVCIIIDSCADYDRVNKGFTINGIKYRRFLGTNGGIKNSTIIYVSENVYPELKKRLDNGRNMERQFVPAKLEAYQALICSGSTPLPKPRGIIVVHDCITHFKDDVVLISDREGKEPELTYEYGYDVEHNNSDGFGFMSPAYSMIVNEYLTGEKNKTIAGMNTRYAWMKGMVYTFDFVEFAEKVAGTYIIQDVWGDPRDVRDADVIVTESMLKLWDSYSSWEDYYRNCEENHYQFATPKVTPDELENVRDTNYQFLQSYEFTDDEISELCKPTFDEIKDAVGLDYRKSLAFLCGDNLRMDSEKFSHMDYSIQALMVEPELINDSYIRRKLWNLIEKRTEMAKRGAIRINGNFAMISGDPYALCQSMFGLEVTGLLKRGEVYHRYWIDKGADEIACFRAPMTCHPNIRKMKLCKSDEAAHWFRYITTAMIYNAWDTATEAMNGSDFDGDTNLTTDNPILLRRTLNSPTILCEQHKAEKCVPTEDHIIQANKLAFNDDIGTITDYVTSMFDVQAGFEKGSKEYDTLAYRIMCGQSYQQQSIDRIKGIIADPMPTYWYTYRDCMLREGDDAATKAQKDFNRKIVAENKPYFMTYVYPQLRTKYNDYVKGANGKAARVFRKYGIKTVEDVRNRKRKTKAMRDFLGYYDEYIPVGIHPCTINRICWQAEKELGSQSKRVITSTDFDYSILKCGSRYTKDLYNKLAMLYCEYHNAMNRIQRKIREEKVSKWIDVDERTMFVNSFKIKCAEICTNEQDLCDILIDMCYKTDGMKSFVWDVAGDIIVRNLLKRKNGIITYPAKADGYADFTFAGKDFVMKTMEVEYGAGE